MSKVTAELAAMGVVLGGQVRIGPNYGYQVFRWGNGPHDPGVLLGCVLRAPAIEKILRVHFPVWLAYVDKAEADPEPVPVAPASAYGPVTRLDAVRALVKHCTTNVPEVVR